MELRVPPGTFLTGPRHGVLPMRPRRSPRQRPVSRPCRHQACPAISPPTTIPGRGSPSPPRPEPVPTIETASQVDLHFDCGIRRQLLRIAPPGRIANMAASVTNLHWRKGRVCESRQAVGHTSSPSLHYRPDFANATDTRAHGDEGDARGPGGTEPELPMRRAVLHGDERPAQRARRQARSGYCPSGAGLVTAEAGGRRSPQRCAPAAPPCRTHCSRPRPRQRSGAPTLIVTMGFSGVLPGRPRPVRRRRRRRTGAFAGAASGAVLG